MSLTRSGYGMTGMGAVGGPRGVAAGGLRVLIEFITSYNPGAVQQAKADLASLEQGAAISAGRESSRQRQIASITTQLAQSTAIVKSKLDNDEQAAIRKTQILRQTGAQADVEAANTQYAAVIQGAQASGKITDQQAAQLLQVNTLEEKKAKLIAQSERAQEKYNEKTKPALENAQAQVTATEKVGSTIKSQLSGLALGALGGIVGGTILGVGFTLAEGAIKDLGEHISDLLDPSRHARDAVDALGTSVAKIASQQSLTYLDAAKEYLQSLGLAANESTAELLAQAAAIDKVKDAVDLLIQAEEIKLHPDSLGGADQIARLKQLAEEVDKVNGTLHTVTVEKDVGSGHFGQILVTIADDTYYTKQATEQYDGVLNATTADTNAAAAAASDLALAQRDAGASAAYAAIMEKQYADAMGIASDASQVPLQNQIDALSSSSGGGESAKSTALQHEIDLINEEASAEQYASQLAQAQENLELLLLKQKLELMGTAINLEGYSGTFLVTAIDAKIAALNKEGDAQSRLNTLLSLQYNESQTQMRNSGESIQAFEERKAQQNRDFLQQHADLARQDQVDELTALRDKTQEELDIAKSKSDLQSMIDQHTRDAKLKILQDELANEQKYATASNTAAQKALQDKLKALQKANSDALYYATQANDDQITLAIQGANTITELLNMEGTIHGLEAARSTILGLVEGFGLDPSVANPMLSRIQAVLNGYYNKLGRLEGGHSSDYRVGGYAEGGVFQLSNSTSMFGKDIRYGEQGTETGVILSHRVTEAIKRNTEQVSFGDINLQGSGDFYRDKYELQQMIRTTVREALR